MHSAGNAHPYADKHCCEAGTACHLLDTSAVSLVHSNEMTQVPAATTMLLPPACTRMLLRPRGRLAIS